MIAILGSGFGLYGYLPAFIAACDQPIVLPESYRARFADRAELARFADRVRWSTDAADALSRAEVVALAKRPGDQATLVPQCLALKDVARLVLEKPLAPTPEAADDIFDRLTTSGKIFRIGYTFRETAWVTLMAQRLRAAERGRLTICWRFMAHHFAHNLRNWKRFADQGGGVIRFYGIQAIALLAELGYRDVPASQSSGANANEVDRWTATFAGPALPDCEVVVDSRSPTSEFSVEQESSRGSPHRIVAQSDPFSTVETTGGLDRRVALLARLCASLWQRDTDCYAWYGATNDLWRNVEARTRFGPTVS